MHAQRKVITMAEDYTSLRVPRALAQRLKRMQDSLHLQYTKGLLTLPEDQIGGVTVRYILTVLCDRYDAHQERAQKSKAKKRAGRKGEAGQPED